MSSSPFDEVGRQFAWDSTSIKLAETCLYKYQLKMIYGWQPQRKSAHLIFGMHYATALEHYHKLVAEGMDKLDATVEVVRETLIATWEYPTCPDCGGSGIIPGTPEQLAEERKVQPGAKSVDFDCATCGTEGKLRREGQPWASDHNLKTRGNLIRTIIWYLDHFADDSCKTVTLSNGSAAVELSFKLPVDDDIILSGHLDRLVDYSGKLYIQDQKTTGSTISTRYFNQYNPDTQMSLYTFAGKSIFNLPVKGVMIDAAQIAVGFTRFERGFTFRDEGQLNEWFDSAMNTISRARQAVVDNYFPMNPSSCNNFGGCEFRDVCSKSPRVREQFLKADFVKGKIWNPLENR